MSFILQPWQLLFIVFASWVHREQQAIIAFYQVELDALMKAQGKIRVPRQNIFLVRCRCETPAANSWRTITTNEIIRGSAIG